MDSYNFYVYILASTTGTLYLGFTNDLERRSWEHRDKFYHGFTSKYGCNRLVYFEHHTDIYEAIDREKQLKNWNRKKKEVLIRSLNPGWNDLSQEWR